MVSTDCFRILGRLGFNLQLENGNAPSRENAHI
jgi:hypothetical protein